METARTIFAKLTADDYDAVFQLQSHAKTRRYLGGPVTKEDFDLSFEKMLNAKPPDCYWIVREKDTDAFVGLLSITKHHDGVHHEVSYELHPDYWRQGYASEILPKVLEYGFNILGMDELYAETQMKNVASIKLLEKMGMHVVSHVERYGEKQVIYALKNKNLA